MLQEEGVWKEGRKATSRRLWPGHQRPPRLSLFPQLAIPNGCYLQGNKTRELQGSPVEGQGKLMSGVTKESTQKSETESSVLGSASDPQGLGQVLGLL